LTDFKPNIDFLRRVKNGTVYQARVQAKNDRKKIRFVGGPVRAQAHADAGLIVMPTGDGFSIVTLTDAGMAALAAAGQ